MGAAGSRSPTAAQAVPGPSFELTRLRHRARHRADLRASAYSHEGGQGRSVATPRGSGGSERPPWARYAPPREGVGRWCSYDPISLGVAALGGRLLPQPTGRAWRGWGRRSPAVLRQRGGSLSLVQGPAAWGLPPRPQATPVTSPPPGYLQLGSGRPRRRQTAGASCPGGGWVGRAGWIGGRIRPEPRNWVPRHQVEAIREMVMGGQVAPFYQWRGQGPAKESPTLLRAPPHYPSRRAETSSQALRPSRRCLSSCWRARFCANLRRGRKPGEVSARPENGRSSLKSEGFGDSADLALADLPPRRGPFRGG